MPCHPQSLAAACLHAAGDLSAHPAGPMLSDAAGDLSARLAVVPMAQEGRGLDAGPRLVQRLRSANDHRTADIVERICLEEMAHVAIGAGYPPDSELLLESTWSEARRA